MMRKYTIIIIYFLAHSLVVHADDKEENRYAAASTAGPVWQDTSIAMLSGDYMRSADNNRKIVQEGLSAYSSRTLSRAGIYAPAVGVLGAAISLAANDRRYSLNDSKTLGLMLKDSASSRRSVMLEFRTDW